jgi:hypothetical protein
MLKNKCLFTINKCNNILVSTRRPGYSQLKPTFEVREINGLRKYLRIY